MNDNIAAISTAAGVGGVAIIRISGPNPLAIAEKMFKPTGKTRVENFTPNFMYTGKIICDGFEDFGMCVYFKAPKSFTGEDVVEFHCHGGVQIARGVLSEAIRLGATAAEKGEFTKRAFVNGKLSLSSAEGMIDMINAESSALVRAGNMLYSEKLTSQVRELQSALKDTLAEIAANSDYPEEDLQNLNEDKIADKIRLLSERLEALSSTYSCGRKIKDGVTVAICGKPNTGKSSLLNALLGYDKAIVSSEAGTTRDAVEGSVELNGVKFNLIDTAGIRECAGEVESIGIERAKKILASADVVLSVTDGSGAAELPETSAEVITVFNKCDLRKANASYGAVVSAKTGEGLENLKNLLADKALGELSLDKAYIIEQRHFDALARANQSLNNALENIGVFTWDILAIDLKEAWEALGEITGETANESIINTVFEKFCVGK